MARCNKRHGTQWQADATDADATNAMARREEMRRLSPKVPFTKICQDLLNDGQLVASVSTG